MNFNNSEVIWINQTLYSYKDKLYHSDGYFELNVSLTTKDYINFSQPKLNFCIDNESKRRVASLSISNVLDLLNSFNEVSKNIQEVYKNPQTGDITKRYNKNKDLIFEYRADKNTREPLVKIKVSFGHSDEGKVIIPYNPEYIVIGRLLRLFYENYSSWCVTLPMRFINGQMLLESRLQTTLIKTLPSQIIQVDNSDIKLPKVCAPAPISTPVKNPSDDPQFEVSMEEFDKFVEIEEPKVVIKELESTPIDSDELPKTQEYQSTLINDILQGDIRNYETLLTASISTINPFQSILNTFNQKSELISPTFLPDIDLKSTLYISNFYFKLYFHSLINNGSSLPVNIPIIKFKPSQIFEKEKELAYDLFMINCYLKSYRSRRESTNPDSYNNGALLYFISRCYLDILTFSFLDGNIETIKNYITSRFIYFREKGFFKYFDELLKDNSCTEISAPEINECVDYSLRISSEKPNVLEYHQELYDNETAKLPPKNKFSIEQILNDIVYIEVQVLHKKKVEELTSDENILELFKPRKKKKKNKKDDDVMNISTNNEKTKRETNILRWVKFKINEIPESIKDEFVKYVEELGTDSDYDFTNTLFNEDELGENIVKGLYIWNSNKKSNYTEFAVQIEECIDKTLILSKLKEVKNLEDTTGSENGNWV